MQSVALEVLSFIPCALHTFGTFGEPVTLNIQDPSSPDETTTQVFLGVIGFEVETECIDKTKPWILGAA